MASNITASEVRYAGNLGATEFPDGRLESAAFIPVGEAWLQSILDENGVANFAALDATKKALAKAAEILFVASIAAMSLPADDFQSGPIKSTSKADTRSVLADKLRNQARDLLSKAGLRFETWTFGSIGAESYSPTGEEDTNIDFSTAVNDPNLPFNLLGVEE